MENLDTILSDVPASMLEDMNMMVEEVRCLQEGHYSWNMECINIDIINYHSF